MSRCTKNYGVTNSQFVQKLKAKSSTKEELNNWYGIKGKKLTSFDKFLIPAVIGENHWVLYVIGDGKITLYDSMNIKRGGDGNLESKLFEFMKWQKCELCRLSIEKDIPKQKNGYDCGVFLMEYARCILTDKPMNFKQKDMPAIRERIKRELEA